VNVQDHALDLPDDIDLAFIALHGEFGEDGAIQKLLRKRGVPYTGSDPQASEASFDKRISKRIFRDAGIPTPDYEMLRAGGRRTLPLPVVIKPPCQGSSIGVHKVFVEDEWQTACADAFQYGAEVLVEAYIPGRELTVGIIGNEALPVVEIVAPNDWYDYDAKYTPGSTNYIVPAPIAEKTAQQCQQLALRTFRALGCRGLGRVDFRMTEAGQTYVLELNNIPGFTKTSLLPKAAEAAGIKFHELCDRIARLAAL
jgi:D-alanine-D-alanine ligase